MLLASTHPLTIQKSDIGASLKAQSCTPLSPGHTPESPVSKFTSVQALRLRVNTHTSHLILQTAARMTEPLEQAPPAATHVEQDPEPADVDIAPGEPHDAQGA